MSLADVTEKGRRLHLGIATDGAGSHPAAWRYPGASPGELFSAAYYVGLAREAERAGFDFLTIDDSFAPQSDWPQDARGRFDALQLAARIAPATTRVGIVPTVTVTHTEPFHVSTGLATLDFISLGRAGWQLKISGSDADARLFGRKGLAPPGEMYAEALEAAEVVTGLWDTWEDDAEIRHSVTGRFIDNKKLHYLDFQGRFFSVRGPSITPRPPQGRLVVVVGLDHPEALPVAAEMADLVRVPAADAGEAAEVRARVRDAVSGVGRDPDSVAVLADIEVTLGATAAEASAALTELDRLAGRPYVPAGFSFAGPPAGLADLLEHWFTARAADGFVLRPTVLPVGLTALADEVVPLLAGRGLIEAASGEGAPATTLRERLGLPAAENRFTALTGGPRSSGGHP